MTLTLSTRYGIINLLLGSIKTVEVYCTHSEDLIHISLVNGSVLLRIQMTVHAMAMDRLVGNCDWPRELKGYDGFVLFDEK